MIFFLKKLVFVRILCFYVHYYEKPNKRKIFFTTDWTDNKNREIFFD